jgi:hypothetical protein
MNNEPKCQCVESCNHPPLSELMPFCIKHHKSCFRISPLSGYEPKYNPKRYNKTRRIRESHNCYSYAIDLIDLPSKEICNEEKCNIPYHQPGRYRGFPKWSKTTGKRCPDLIARLKSEIPGLSVVNFTDKCPPRTSKIALVVDPKEDYHFYRQDSNGLWSHKPGGTNVTNLDADQKLIYDPAIASRNYTKDGKSDLNYKYFCSYMCVPRGKKIKTVKRGGAKYKRRRTIKK